jgi:preprotein translocase subunit SecD
MLRDCKKAGMSGLFLCASFAFSVAMTPGAAAEPITIEVAHATLAVDKRMGWPVVAFTMTEASKRLFAEFTGRHVGRKAEFRLDGRVVMTAVIREPILGGAGQISDRSLTVEQAKEMAARMSSGQAKIEIDVAPN